MFIITVLTCALFLAGF